MRALYRKVTLPMLSLSFTDDEYMSASNVAVLQDLSVARIGHFGFFREETGRRLWPLALDWVNAVI